MSHVTGISIVCLHVDFLTNSLFPINVESWESVSGQIKRHEGELRSG